MIPELITHEVRVPNGSTADDRKLEKKGEAKFQKKIDDFLRTRRPKKKGKQKYDIQYEPVSIIKKGDTVAIKHCALVIIY